MNFSERLKKLREDHNYTQQQLADALHVSKNSISHYELKVSMPSIDVMIEIADLFDVTLDYLLGRTNVNLSNKLLVKPIDKNTTVEQAIESILKLDREHRADLIKLLRYIELDNKRV